MFLPLTLQTGDPVKLQMCDTKTWLYLKIAFKGKFVKMVPM